jgi:hypothetical protein
MSGAEDSCRAEIGLHEALLADTRRAAALVSTNLDLSARNAYQAHDGSVRLSDR